MLSLIHISIWGIVGLLCLLSILPIDGVLLKWLHRGIGALIGKGAYVMPFALIGICLLYTSAHAVPAKVRHRIQPIGKHLFAHYDRVSRGLAEGNACLLYTSRCV